MSLFFGRYFTYALCLSVVCSNTLNAQKTESDVVITVVKDSFMHSVRSKTSLSFELRKEIPMVFDDDEYVGPSLSTRSWSERDTVNGFLVIGSSRTLPWFNSYRNPNDSTRDSQFTLYYDSLGDLYCNARYRTQSVNHNILLKLFPVSLLGYDKLPAEIKENWITRNGYLSLPAKYVWVYLEGNKF